MTLTPLHVAFVWILRLKLGLLQFAPLTVGAVIPDMEIIFFWIFGDAVFCGWNLGCFSAPDRLVMHSIVGALTVDVLLTTIFIKIIDKYLNLEKMGIYGFSNVKMGKTFFLSASVGSLSHVFIDWFHHSANPILWPFQIHHSYFVDGLLLPYTDINMASIIIAIISGFAMLYVIKQTLNTAGHSFWFIISNPIMALSLITKSLNK